MKKIIIVNSSLKHCGVDEYCITLYNIFKNEFRFYFALKKGSDFEKNISMLNTGIFYLSNSYLKNIKGLRKFIIENDINIVHIHTAKDYYLTFVKKNVNKVKFIITRHNSFRLNYFPNIFFFEKCDLIIAVSNYVKNSFLKQFKNQVNKVKVVYNCIDEDYTGNNDPVNNNSFDINSKQNKLNNLMGNEENKKKFYLGFIGRITYQKGLHILIKAFSIFLKNIEFFKNKNIISDNENSKSINKAIEINYNHANNRDIKLIVAGRFIDKAYKKLIKREIKINNLQNHVVFKGFVKEKNEFFKDVDIVVIPSLKTWQEAFGLIALESFYYKKPLITSESGALPEININGITGFVYSDDNANNLYNFIKRFYFNPELISQMGINGYKRLRDKFTINNFKDKMNIIYNECTL